MAFLSLIGVMFCFVPDDWKISILARKNFRLSMNLSSLQLNLDGDLFPDTTPVLGNGGTNVTYPSNADFFYHLIKMFKIPWDKQDTITVNPANFAINTREWDPSSQANNIPGPYNL
jgi:hypothetical protein